MSNSTTVLLFPPKPKKQLIKVANEYISSRIGHYGDDDVIAVIEDAARRLDFDFLIKETAKSIAQQVIKARSTPHLSHNDDWIGYGDLVISLPEAKLVNVRYAEYGVLDIRKAHVIENRDQIVKAADLEIQRIDRIQMMMMKMQVDIAGPALDVLAAIRKAA